MAERGLPIAHTTILRWVQRYAPEFDKRWSRFSAQAGTSWRVDETYVRIRGRWAYLYRAVDASGKTVDFRLSPSRNVASAKAFFRNAKLCNSLIKCLVSCDHIPRRSWPLFRAKAMLGDLIAGFSSSGIQSHQEQLAA